MPTLSDFPLVKVRVNCAACGLRKAYLLARLAEKYGATFDLGMLLENLTRACPRWGEEQVAIRKLRCGLRFTDYPDTKPKLRVIK